MSRKFRLIQMKRSTRGRYVVKKVLRSNISYFDAQVGARAFLGGAIQIVMAHGYNQEYFIFYQRYPMIAGYQHPSSKYAVVIQPQEMKVKPWIFKLTKKERDYYQ